MKALTVQQPWAWAIVHGSKGVENRSRNLAGSYRGPVAIHAGLREDPSALDDPVLWHALFPDSEPHPLADPKPLAARGAIIGVVDLVSVHHDSDHGRGYPCSQWAQPDLWHLVLENPRPLPVPIPCRGALGLWTPPPVVLEQLQAVAGPATHEAAAVAETRTEA